MNSPKRGPSSRSAELGSPRILPHGPAALPLERLAKALRASLPNRPASTHGRWKSPRLRAEGTLGWRSWTSDEKTADRTPRIKTGRRFFCSQSGRGLGIKMIFLYADVLSHQSGGIETYLHALALI